MKKGSLNFFELHLEKIVAGAAGAFLLYMVWAYMIGTPNTVQYSGQDVGPRDLDQAILNNARELDRRVDQAKPNQQTITRYGDVIKKEHEDGIQAAALTKSNEPAERRLELRLAATFGKPIEIPGEKQSEETPGSVALIKPLRPTRLAAKAYRSMAVKKQIELGGPTPAAAKPEDKKEKNEPVETVAVTVAGYYDTEAQKQEMTQASYATHRAKVYVAGVDVQRQEMLASGEWSDWQDVKGSKAMPKLDLPQPAFDDQTQEVLNKSELGQSFMQVKQMQNSLMQPAFYPVTAGDHWEMPPLQGFEAVDDDEDEPIVKQRPPKEPPQQRVTPGPRPSGAQRNPRGEGTEGPAINPRGGFNRGGSIPGGGRFSGGEEGGGAADESKAKAEGRKQGQKDIKDAGKAFQQKDLAEARNKANSVIGNPNANKGDQQRARELLAKIEKADAQARKSTTGGPGNEGLVSGPGGGGRRGPGGSLGGEGLYPDYMTSGGSSSQTLVAHPENSKQLAVWFHDDSVVSGKTYRYRMRVKLWNRYTGEAKLLRDPQGAKQSVLLGDWSVPSEPLTVTPSAYFFIKGPRNDREAANVDVWKWQQGTWLKETFEVAVGDVIGGPKKTKTGDDDKDGKPIVKEIDFTTGAVVLDLRLNERVKQRTAKGKAGEFDYNERNSVVLVYLDPADGQIKEKVQLEDRYDPIYKMLQDQAAP